MNVQELSDADAFVRIRLWIFRCTEVKELEPSVGYFDELIIKAIKRVRNTGITEMSIPYQLIKLGFNTTF